MKAFFSDLYSRIQYIQGTLLDFVWNLSRRRALLFKAFSIGKFEDLLNFKVC